MGHADRFSRSAILKAEADRFAVDLILNREPRPAAIIRATVTRRAGTRPHGGAISMPPRMRRASWTWSAHTVAQNSLNRIHTLLRCEKCPTSTQQLAWLLVCRRLLFSNGGQHRDRASTEHIFRLDSRPTCSPLRPRLPSSTDVRRHQRSKQAARCAAESGRSHFQSLTDAGQKQFLALCRPCVHPHAAPQIREASQLR
jgi:hypothetical protein